jgi:hypothetical protein
MSDWLENLKNASEDKSADNSTNPEYGGLVQSDSPTSGAFALILFIALLLLGVIVGGLMLNKQLQSQVVLPAGVSEVVTVRFDRALPTYTQHEYSGKVTLLISGTGQAGGNSMSDAFYLFTDEQGNLRNPPQTEAFDLEIDGRRAIITLGLRDNPPMFTANHTYSVSYDVGPTPRRIAFRISDLIVDDNKGMFTVQISNSAR